MTKQESGNDFLESRCILCQGRHSFRPDFYYSSDRSEAAALIQRLRKDRLRRKFLKATAYAIEANTAAAHNKAILRVSSQSVALHRRSRIDGQPHSNKPD